MEIPLFGQINSLEPKIYYEEKISISGNIVEIDLNFESNKIEDSLLVELSNYLKKLDTEVKKAFKAISEDWDLDEESETARFYLEHHLDVFSQNEIDKIFGTKEIDKTLFLNTLVLTRIGIYPENSESYAIFDIQFSKNFTDYLMAVTFNNLGELSEISMDS
ncbi:DUF2004 domain-containing protein [Candidatus Uabimicrobium sp. HlEnr_7]|uniref:DUF2004 domain-containing protein n=1 Tax=Candidatus Uabimicrobium helgolandensis TaxID=3095367 RepID=UPI003557F2F3